MLSRAAWGKTSLKCTDWAKNISLESDNIFVHVSWNGLAYNGSRRSQSAPLKGLIWMGLPALVDDELANFFFDDADEDPFVEDSAERWNLVRLGQQVGLLGDFDLMVNWAIF